jgi:DNA-directed RNA polymerase sigma subunit (sigma70/sigma32)
VIELRFGLGGGEPVPLQAVGDELGVTRERARQIERAALEQLSRNRELADLREAA